MFKQSIIGIMTALLLGSISYGEDLAEFGLSGVTKIEAEEATAIRGEGLDTVALAATQLFIFDYVSGASLNLQASSLNSNLNVNFDAADAMDESDGAHISTISTTKLSAFEIGIDNFFVDTQTLKISAFGTAGVGVVLPLE